MTREKFAAPRGTKDVLPGLARQVQAFEGVFAEMAELYGFGPIATPAFEYTEIFERGVGEATDIVTKEMYTFDDRAGRSVALRPEGTAPVVRAFLEHGIGKSGRLPWKVYYSGPMWRYERPQAGRMREFRQVGAESIGSDDPSSDVELIEFAVRFLRRSGTRRLRLFLNSMGDSRCRPAYKAALVEYFQLVISSRHPLCDDCMRRLELNPLRVLDCKKLGCRELSATAPTTIEFLCEECDSHFSAVKAGLEELEIEFEVDPRLVRGLDYYTRTTFEIQCPDLDASQDALGGGGRYDRLVETLGGDPTPGLGFAIGTERTLLATRRDPGRAEQDSEQTTRYPEVVIIPLLEDARNQALKTASLLRQAGIACDLAGIGRSLKANLRRATRDQARLAILIGEDELAAGEVTLRFLEGGESLGQMPQESCSPGSAADRIAELLRQR